MSTAHGLDEPFTSDRIASVEYPLTSRLDRRSWPLYVVAGMRLTDVILLLSTTIIIYMVPDIGGGLELGPVILAGGYATTAAIYCIDWGGTYQVEQRLAILAQAIIAAMGLGVIVFALCLDILHVGRVGLLTVGTWGCLGFACLMGARSVWKRLLRQWAASGTFDKNVALVGINNYSENFVRRAEENLHSTLRIIGIYSDKEASADKNTFQRDGMPLPDLNDLVVRARSESIHAVVLAVPLSEARRVDRLCHSLRSLSAEIYAIPDPIVLHNRVNGLHALGPNLLIRVREHPLNERQQLQKTIFDRFFGVLLLVALMPLLLFIALVIRAESPGPVLFRQSRIGLNNQKFIIFKFRTMYHHSDPASMSGLTQARRNDPRVTRVGKWVRKLSLDELPQLLNVLKGEMSLVGPRPHPPETRAADHRFEDVVADYEMRHRVRPGITGWAQVSGWRGETSKLAQIEQRVAHDLYYIDNWSMLFDLRIIALTFVEMSRVTAF